MLNSFTITPKNYDKSKFRSNYSVEKVYLKDGTKRLIERIYCIIMFDGFLLLRKDFDSAQGQEK